jgi:general secretion pathway protein K
MMQVLNAGSSRGVALIIVLWVVVILSVIALEFSYSTRIETDLTRNFFDGQKAYFGARSGIERAIKEILRYRKAAPLFKDDKEEPLWSLIGKPNQFDMGDINIFVVIEPENARININDISKEYLRAIILNMGLTEEAANTIIDSLLDWQDGDNLHRMKGAEKDYYQELDTPYQPTNSGIEILEELLLIKGIDKKLFYGEEALPAISDFVSEEDDEEKEFRLTNGLSSIFTVYSEESLKKDEKQSKININSASLGVLMCLPLMDEGAAQAIIDARKEAPIINVADLVNLIGLPLYKGIQQYITLKEADARYYTITSTAFSGDQGMSHSIKAVVDIKPKVRMGSSMAFNFVRWEDCKI